MSSLPCRNNFLELVLKLYTKIEIFRSFICLLNFTNSLEIIYTGLQFLVTNFLKKNRLGNWIFHKFSFLYNVNSFENLVQRAFKLLRAFKFSISAHYFPVISDIRWINYWNQQVGLQFWPVSTDRIRNKYHQKWQGSDF